MANHTQNLYSAFNPSKLVHTHIRRTHTHCKLSTGHIHYGAQGPIVVRCLVKGTSVVSASIENQTHNIRTFKSDFLTIRPKKICFVARSSQTN